MKTFLGLAPNCIIISTQLKAAAPAPLTTIFTAPIFFSANSKALINAALLMMAVPCWSSCMMGMSNSAFNRSSISKASGAFKSSKLMPPKVGEIFFTVLMNSSTSVAFTSISMLSMSAKILNNMHFPSITGLEASGPKFPNPKMAVPLEITATKFPLAV